MQKLLPILTLLFLMACNGSKSKPDPQAKANYQHDRKTMIGTWKMDQGGEEKQNNNGKDKMTISDNGQILYEIEQNGSIERMDLVYGIHGDTLITAKLTDPTEERALFRFEKDDNKLILESHGVRSVFIRSTK